MTPVEKAKEIVERSAPTLKFRERSTLYAALDVVAAAKAVAMIRNVDGYIEPETLVLVRKINAFEAAVEGATT